MNRRLELTGQKFNRLTIIEFSHMDKWGTTCWLCKCDCGNEKIVQSGNLRRGKIKSCGCLRSEQAIENIKKVRDRRLPKGIAARNQAINTHKQNAKSGGLEQALTDEQIIALHKENCHYCGAPPSNEYSTKYNTGSYTYNGIDRVDNDKGYFIDNVVSCCDFCNKAKRNMPIDEFLDHIKRIHSHLNLDA